VTANDFFNVIHGYGYVDQGSGVARGGLNPPNPLHSHQSRFFHSRKVTVIKYYNLSLTTRRTINSHDLRKTNHLGGVYCPPIDTILW